MNVTIEFVENGINKMMSVPLEEVEQKVKELELKKECDDPEDDGDFRLTL